MTTMTTIADPRHQALRIVIGIPCFNGVSHEVLDDYMRFAFALGRCYQDFEFQLAVKGKSEQFRARNAIVEAGMQNSCDYILMLDDDQVLDTRSGADPDTPSSDYGFLMKMIDFMEDRQEVGILGALYFQRGGDYYPVFMQEKDGGYFFQSYHDIAWRPQKVAVTGGGCMLLRASMLRKIEPPWFEPEMRSGGPSRGTDIQICRRAAEHGYEVWCDTSIKLGHVRLERDVITADRVRALKLEQLRNKGTRS
jgi:hypothetical protein